MEGMDPSTITDFELRNQICKKLSEQGISSDLLTPLFHQLGSKSLKHSQNQFNNLHLVKACGLPNIEILDLLLAQNESATPKPKGTAILVQDPFYYALVYTEIPTVTRADSSQFLKFLEYFLKGEKKVLSFVCIWYMKIMRETP